MEPITIEYSLTLDEAAQAYERQFRKRAILIAAIYLVLSVAAIFNIALAIPRADPISIAIWLGLLAWGVIGLITSGSFTKRLIRPIWSQVPSMQVPKRVTFTADGVRTESVHEQSFEMWSKFTHWDETSLDLIAREGLAPHIFPKRVMSPKQLEQLRTAFSVFIGRTCPDPSRGFDIVPAPLPPETP